MGVTPGIMKFRTSHLNIFIRWRRDRDEDRKVGVSQLGRADAVEDLRIGCCLKPIAFDPLRIRIDDPIVGEYPVRHSDGLSLSGRARVWMMRESPRPEVERLQ